MKLKKQNFSYNIEVKFHFVKDLLKVGIKLYWLEVMVLGRHMRYVIEQTGLFFHKISFERHDMSFLRTI
jgi:hypothetical protein